MFVLTHYIKNINTIITKYTLNLNDDFKVCWTKFNIPDGTIISYTTIISVNPDKIFIQSVQNHKWKWLGLLLFATL